MRLTPPGAARGDEDLGGARSVIHDLRMRRYLGALLLATGLMLGPLGMACAPANQDDPRLDDLFARLKATDDPAEVQQLNDQIWFIWLDSGREEIDALMLEGRRFVERGVLHSALGNFGFIIKLDPDYAEAWHRRASVHYRMGNFTSSIEDIERTLALEPRHFGALAGLGLIYLELGQERAALEALERALEVNPHLSGTRFKVEELKEKLHGKETHRLTPTSPAVG